MIASITARSIPKGSGDTYPQQDMEPALYVVSTLSTSNGVGGTYSWTYNYAGLVGNLWGRGKEEAFQTITKTDSQTGIVQTMGYCYWFPLLGLVQNETVKSGSVTLKSVTQSYYETNIGGSGAGQKNYFVAPNQNWTSGADLDNTPWPSSNSTITYDSYGNVHINQVNVSDGSSQTTTNTYDYDTGDWIVNELATSQTENVVGSSDVTRHFSFTPDPHSGQVTLANIEPGNTTLAVQFAYGYDPYGNRNSVTTSGNAITTRTSTASFASTNPGEFLSSDINALTQQESWTFDARFGGPTMQTDLNGRTPSWSYDTFGPPYAIAARR
jgi:hypothetical protein